MTKYNQILGFSLDILDQELLVNLSFSPLKNYELSGGNKLRIHDLKRLGLVWYDGRWRTTHSGELVVEEILNEREWEQNQ